MCVGRSNRQRLSKTRWSGWSSREGPTCAPVSRPWPSSPFATLLWASSSTNVSRPHESRFGSVLVCVKNLLSFDIQPERRHFHCPVSTSALFGLFSDMFYIHMMGLSVRETMMELHVKPHEEAQAVRLDRRCQRITLAFGFFQPLEAGNPHLLCKGQDCSRRIPTLFCRFLRGRFHFKIVF